MIFCSFFVGESNKNPRLCRGNQRAFASSKNLLCYHYIESAKTQESIGGFYRKPLAHTSWEFKYHIVFAPKYRRQVIYGKMKAEIGEILRELCERKGIESIAAECCPDHIHMLLRIPPKYSVSEIVGYLKGKSAFIIFHRYASLKYKYGNRTFWCREYYVDRVGKNTKKRREYSNKQ